MIRYCKLDCVFKYKLQSSYRVSGNLCWHWWHMDLSILTGWNASMWPHGHNLSITTENVHDFSTQYSRHWQAFNITVNSCFSGLPVGEHCRPHILKCCDFIQALAHFYSTKIILFDCWIWSLTHEGFLKHLGWLLQSKSIAHPQQN